MTAVRALLAALFALAVPVAARKTPPALCPDARFVVRALAGAPASGSQVLVVGAEVSIAGVCAPVAAKRKAHPKVTAVRVVWPDGACAGVPGRLKLQAAIGDSCSTIGGVATDRKARIKRKVVGASSRCGDGFVDAGRGEECDGAACPGGACTAACTCGTSGPNTTTTTTTVPPVTTRCCQAVGACIDVDAADADALCSQQALKGTLAPAGQVCDAGNTAGSMAGPQCGAVASHGARCCQCMSQSPPFPHGQYCFESNTSSCGSVCTSTIGGTCDPVSETCQP